MSYLNCNSGEFNNGGPFAIGIAFGVEGLSGAKRIIFSASYCCLRPLRFLRFLLEETVKASEAIGLSWKHFHPLMLEKTYFYRRVTAGFLFRTN